MSPALFVFLALASSAPDTDAVIERAEAHFTAGEYDRASEAFAEAFALDPNPKYLYARAQAERLAGDCETALQLYNRFLDTRPPEEQAEPARINRARCEAVLERLPPPPPEAPEQVEPEPVAPLESAPASPWYRDPWGGSLIGAGTLVSAVGAGLLGSAIAGDRDAVDAPIEDDFIEEKHGAKVRHRTGIALLSIGGALLVGGSIRWALVARSNRDVRPTAAWLPGGATFGLTGRF